MNNLKENEEGKRHKFEMEKLKGTRRRWFKEWPINTKIIRRTKIKGFKSQKELKIEKKQLKKREEEEEYKKN